MRKPKKPTKKQKEVIDILIRELESWKNTNDLDSPTHRSDLHSFLSVVDADLTKLGNVARKASRLLNEIKEL